MHPLLVDALDEAAPLFESRGWARPSDMTLAEAHRVLDLTRAHRPPTVEIDADGSVRLEWDASDAGWLALTVNGSGHIQHRAVIGADEFEQTEDFGEALPAWAGNLLARLLRLGH